MRQIRIKLAQTTLAAAFPVVFAFVFTLAAHLPVYAVTATAPAAAASAQSARRLAALCDGCALVTAVRTDKRKGKASGVGAAGGAIAGGVVGNKAGDGGVLATGAGAVLGGVLGNEIEKQVKRRKVWITTVTGRDGKVHKFERDSDPGFTVGQTVRIKDGTISHLDAAKK